MGEQERYERLITVEDLEAEHLPLPVIQRILGIVAIDHSQPTLEGLEHPQETLF